MLHRVSVPALFALVCLLLGARSAAAQCQTQWLAGDPRLVPGGVVNATALWDPDGAGPLPLQCVIGGSFAAANASQANVATWDGAQWNVLAGLTGSVTALAVLNGQLHAATITTIVIFGNPTTTYSVQVWNGTTWQAIATPSGPVLAMTTFNGELVAGGSFASIGGVAANNVATWNGSAWAPFGTGVQGTVRALTSFNGSLYVGGYITSAGGAPASHLARWSGSAWFAGPTFNAEVYALAVRSAIVVGQSYLFVGGAFSSVTVGATPIAAPRIARFEPQANAWIGITSGASGTRCTTLLVRSVGVNGYEVAAGFEDAASAQRVWRLATGTWSALGTLGDTATSLVPSSLTYFGGRYTVACSSPTNAVRSFDGATWTPANGAGIAGTVFAVCPLGNELVIGGSFTTISGTTMNGIARGGPGAWTPLGSGVQGGLGVLGLAVAPNGDVFATGSFTSAGGQPANFIARWNGSTWSPLGSGLSYLGQKLLVLPNGDLVVGGNFATAGGVACNGIARWNGTTWSPFGTGTNGTVYALARLDNGDLVAAGSFTSAGGVAASNIARWNGASWSPLGSGTNGLVTALTVGANGDLFAGGTFTVAGGLTTRVAKWSSGAWSSVFTIGVTTQQVITLCAHPNGDLFIGGEPFSFSLGPFGSWTSNLLRNVGGSSLSPMNVQGLQVIDSTIHDGDLVIAGAFDTTAGVVSPNLARFHSSCAATATPFGSGCNGLTAPLSLAAVTPPWVGGSWQLRASTLAPVSFVLRSIGFAPLPSPIPLAAILPGSLPGCVGLVPPDITDVLLPTSSVLTITTAVPANPALAGLQLNEQVVQFEAAPGGAIAISSSNAVQLVVGVF